MNILFDNQIFDLQRFGGISRMYTDIKNTLNETDEFNVDISIKETENEYLKDSYPSGKTKNFSVSEEYLKKGDFDIFYPTYFYTNFLNNIGNKPFVMSVHDMIPEIYEEYFSRNDLQIVGKREMVKRAAAIEVPSECTKKDLVRILGVDESKIHVVGRALDPNFGEKYYDKNVLDFDYILYVGGRDYYKRFDWFIKHIAPFLENHKDIHVVCTGKQFNEQEIKLIKQYGLWGRVNTIFADDLTMASLYKYAKFFVFSSEYEGFGLPVLESYKMGCIALLNDIEVFREITDGEGTFFSLKENESNLSEVAERVFSLSDKEKETILNTQYKILAKYSFDKYINNIKEMFKSVLNNKKITVITINYNNAEGLKKTIHTVTTQTYFDKIEYVVIDGGSTDGSKEIIEQNKDKFSYWCSEPDKGIYNAMNKGISHSNSEYLLFINSGDMLFAPDSIEKMYEKLDADIVYGDLCVIYNAKNEAFIKEYPVVITEEYMKNESLPHPSSFIKRDLLKRYNYNENFKIISDWAFFYEQILLNKCTYKHVHEIVSAFYLGGVSSNVSLINKEKKVFYEEISSSPEITVIMPCYNYAHYIKETIDSLKNSTYKKWNCIIVNDGSTDNSEETILKLIDGDRRFIYIKQPNSGASGARNIGIRASNTKYVLCLDPDDKISPTYIENGIKYLNEHEDVTLYYGKAKMFYDDGTEEDWNLPKYSYEQLIYSNCIYSAFIYRKKDYERIGGYDENMRGYEDWEFLVRLLSDNRKIYMTDDVVFYYRRHDNSRDSIASKDTKRYKEYIINKNNEIISRTLEMIDKDK